MTSLLLGAVAFGSANIAFAQQLPGTPLGDADGFTMAFDENGNATINGQPITGTALQGGGIVYDLPTTVATGTVSVFSPVDVSPTNPNGFSDILAFTTGLFGQSVLVYTSFLDDPSHPDLADRLLDVSALPPSPFSVIETGPEGINGFQWIADPSQPNFAIYNGISDGVLPEPSTFVLGGLGLISLLLFGRRRLASKKL